MRVEEEDMSTVKWLSGYVKAGRRQEQRGHHAQGAGKKYASQSICIDPLQWHDLPISTECQRYMTTHTRASLQSQKNRKKRREKSLNTYEKKTRLFYKKGTFSVQTVN